MKITIPITETLYKILHDQATGVTPWVEIRDAIMSANLSGATRDLFLMVSVRSSLPPVNPISLLDKIAFLLRIEFAPDCGLSMAHVDHVRSDDESIEIHIGSRMDVLKTLAEDVNADIERLACKPLPTQSLESPKPGNG